MAENVAKEGLNISEKIRIIFVPMLWLAYSIALFIRLGQFYQHWWFVVIFVMWFLVVFMALQCVIGVASIAYFDSYIFSQSWCNVAMLVYIVSIISPYCVLMYNVNKPVDLVAVKDVQTVDCVVLQAIMPVLITGCMLYPLPKRKSKLAETAAIVIGSLHAFDIMDVMMNFKFIQHFGTAAQAFFYLSFVTSIILIAFPIGLDENDDDDPVMGQIVKTTLSLLFTEISFCVFRFIVMQKENSLSGLVFASKNSLSGLYHAYLVVRALLYCRKVKFRYSRM
ncbi:uncharacterized protein LOC130654452 isoform X1 [Hydractinia symbiolongicarpus]|uniref:uncharacterized protein LOC130654452 isoform X1 n=1 Tax=Hydractinia symbiolongicarpus TaxID=13093 RepID=UPI00254BC384|nr:uncharacterized protein LOC130654452 isoform X1 [Hydractinia symbiolongicarpus]